MGDTDKTMFALGAVICTLAVLPLFVILLHLLPRRTRRPAHVLSGAPLYMRPRSRTRGASGRHVKTRAGFFSTRGVSPGKFARAA